MASDPTEIISEADTEIIISESAGGDPGGTRRLYVYDQGDDYILTIPSDARVTFGYFNPAAPKTDSYRYGNGPGGETMKTTCLRIYADNSDKKQIGAFLGVRGFRDLDKVKKEIRRRKVTIETNFEDDGIGNVNAGRRQLTEGQRVDEDELPF